MTQKEKVTLCSMLWKWENDELNPTEKISADNEDFDRVKKINDLKKYIDEILEALEEE